MGLGVVIAVGGAPDDELAQATSVEVVERVGEATSYRLRYPLDVSDGDLPLLVDGRLGPGSELSVLVPADLGAECLVRGPVHAQQIHLEHGGSGSRLEVVGADTSIVMDREMRSAVWDGSGDSDAVSSIVAGYGYVPDVERTSALHLEQKHTLVQRDSDLRFVRRLARRNGFLFWVTCNALGIETAHFKRPPLAARPDTKLAINLDLPSVLSVDLDWDVERPTSVEALQLDLNTKSDLSGAVAAPPLPLLGSDGLDAVTGDTRSIHVSAPADDAGDLLGRAEGALIDASWFVAATCSTTLEALGSVVRAHTVVELDGLGSRHSGSYFVAGVRHVIDTSSHRMELDLRRNGWGA
jgi:hypothetical protein